MNLIEHFRAAWQQVSLSLTYDSLAESEEHGWNKEDATRLAEFFSSETGQKLKARLSNYVIRSAIDATRRSTDTRYYNGVARGIALAVNALQSIALEQFTASPMRNTDNSDEQPQESVEADIALQ